MNARFPARIQKRPDCQAAADRGNGFPFTGNLNEAGFRLVLRLFANRNFDIGRRELTSAVLRPFDNDKRIRLR